MLPPAATGLGLPLLVTERSHSGSTGVVTDVELLAEFGSTVVVVIDDAAVMEAAATVGARLTTMMMSVEAPEGTLGLVQLMLPVPPTAGVVQAHPAGIEIEENVVLAGTASVKLAPVAVPGPLLVIVCV